MQIQGKVVLACFTLETVSFCFLIFADIVTYSMIGIPFFWFCFPLANCEMCFHTMTHALEVFPVT